MAQKLCDQILVKPEKRARLFDSQKSKPNAAYSMIPEDHFELIAGREHFAILSLCETRDFSADPKWIGTRLGISPIQALAALDRLFRQRLLRVEDHKTVPVHSNVTTAHDVGLTY